MIQPQTGDNQPTNLNVDLNRQKNSSSGKFPRNASHFDNNTGSETSFNIFDESYKNMTNVGQVDSNI